MTKKKLPKTTYIIPVERLARQIYLVRGLKVMLDRDLAELYGVTTGNLNLAVRRNIDRFPEDFIFQLTKEELYNWRLQIVTSNSAAKMGLRRRPYAFTEQGVAMLSSVLRSDRAAEGGRNRWNAQGVAIGSFDNRSLEVGVVDTPSVEPKD